MVGAVATALITIWTAQRLRRDQESSDPTSDDLVADEAPVAAAA
jgi:hypothetical protein